jgi:HD-like signal output (HDOD) protein
MKTTTVEFAAEMRSRLIQRIEADDLDLPVLPDSTSQVLALSQDPDAEPRQLSELIQRDPALAGHVLRIANSAAYAAREPIVSLQQAVSRLGMSTLADIAIAATMNSKVFALKGHDAEMRDMRTHSALAAVWTREVARLRRRNVEAAFLTGLLHDVGKPILLQAIFQIPNASEIDGETVREWIHELHASVGSRLLVRWQLPHWVSAAVRGHHDPDEAGDQCDLASTVLLGDLLSHWTAQSDAEHEERVRQHTVLARLGLYPDDIDELFGRRSVVDAISKAFA